MLKKSTWLALGFAAVSLPSAFSQTVLFSEDFENGMPANFSLFNVDGGTPATNVSFVTGAWVGRLDSVYGGTDNDSVAISTSWYTPAGAADDWMFTPAIAIPATGVYQLRWNAKAIDVDFPDGYEVRIMTAAPTSANITTSTILTTVASENTTWTARRSQPLASYAGQTVYIGFRNNSNDQFLLAVDDIEIVQLPAKDVAVGQTTPMMEYSMYPSSQVSSSPLVVTAELTNVGGLSIDTAGFSAVLVDINTFTPVGMTSGQTLNLATGATATVTGTPSITNPTMPGFYTGLVIASTTGDTTGANDTTFIQPWMVTDTVYARDRDTTDGALGGGLGETVYLGNTFDIIAADTASSISVFFNSSDALTHTTACIWGVDTTGTPTSIVATSMDTITMSAGWQTFRLPANTILPVGKYIVAAVELDSALTVGTSSLDYMPGTSWVNAASLGGWGNVEDFGFEVLLAIRLNLGRSSQPISVNKVADNNALSVMPNPSNGVFNVRLDLQEATDAELVVTSIDGKQLRREQLGMQSTIQRNIDLSELANGMYILQVRTTKGTYTQRITKQ